MKSIKTLLATLAVVACAASAMAVQTQQIWIDDNGVPIVATATSTTGSLILSGSDAYWSVVISVGTAYPPASGQGTITAPVMDLSVTATSLNGSAGHDISVTFAADGYGPTAGAFQGLLTGHVVSGTGSPLTFNTFYNAANVRADNPSATALTSSGSLTGPTYMSLASSGALSLASPYSLTEVITMDGGATGGSYSLDGSLTTVPDGGTTAMLLGAALSVLGLIRRKLA